MSLLDSDVRFYFAENPESGGRVDFSKEVPQTLGGLLPNVLSSERQNGAVRWRKVFLCNRSSPVVPGVNGRVWLDLFTTTDDRVLIYPGTQRDTRGTLSPSRMYGAGYLQASISAGATSLNVVIEDGTDDLFAVGDVIAIHSFKSTSDVEFAEVAAVSKNGNVVSITLATGVQQARTGGLDADGNPITIFASVIEFGDWFPKADSLSVSSSSGGFDLSQIELGVGTIEQTWTLTFTSSTDYDLSGDMLGSVGSGTILGNSSFGSPPYLTLPPSAFSGTFAAGDTITFQTHPAAWPIWVKHIIPAGSGTGQAEFGFQWQVDAP